MSLRIATNVISKKRMRKIFITNNQVNNVGLFISFYRNLLYTAGSKAGNNLSTNSSLSEYI
jgi:hypothetical protein